ncbi:MAG: O-antigen ligase family protein, partial [Methylacidiphilales bacterium]|nr:O-antigen ligase family protein [Candidatus Methylacidiphilales bacterium]
MISRLNQFAIVCSVLLASFLGGGRDPWAWGAILLSTAFCMLIWPSCHSLPRNWFLWSVGFLAWCSMGLWPFALLARPAWQKSLIESADMKLGPFLSAQPWITLESWIILAAGMLWFFYIASLPAGRHQRRALLRWFCYGAFVLAGLALMCYLAGQQFPFWYSPKNLGPFENRNQMACFLAMSGVITLALAVDHLRRRELRAWILAAGFILLLATLFLSFSRAGIALFFGGAGLWILLAFRLSFRRARTWIALSCLLLAFAGFMLFGGKTLQRFTGETAEKLEYGGRAQIQRDAIDMVLAQPVVGVGLGNFAGAFPMYRTHSLTEDFVRHPESDWLWLASETGVPSLILLAGLGLCFFRGCFPFDSGSDRSLRAACLAAGCMLAVHGIVDVSGHRLGTIWPGLLFAALALRPECREAPSRMFTILASIACFLIILISILWVTTSLDIAHFPGSARADILGRKIEQELATGRYSEAKRDCDDAIWIRPLQWNTYFSRAVARLKLHEKVEEAVADFRRARTLEQNSSRLPMEEGTILLPYNPDDALAAWSEALRRCRQGMEVRSVEELYNSMQKQAEKYPALRENLLLVARDFPQLEGYYWMSASKDQADEFLQNLLQQDDTIESSPEKEPDWVWKLWIRVRGLPDMEEFLSDKPQVSLKIWPILLEACVEQQLYEKAYKLLK